MNFRLGKSLVIGAMLISIGGCGDSTGLTTEDLEGTWNATAIVFTNNANSVDTVITPLRLPAKQTWTSQIQMKKLYFSNRKMLPLPKV